ncbi:Isotrichodermin C-15 hydroxylase [Colletotrichum tanaceti]|uniref:Isotrichodermin C-15 hydroxylase n=1 Tax=Colletotrichum tanaceti TaxID=1306861 RepID=A0A4U6XAH4_9PEZI|nr:Isotrichodermin C-15 hydroxylase [Colletotrichum tanaceti]KAJ0168796.1 Isotrichodermin C-15 hydroxylase [Colletotrichum tanaceti]TKW52671.1 Isotrichodermin C-15 hydroxylase [Colletotrichum tanaceti]
MSPVVRVAPNELSFNTAQSWKDIYDKRKGHETFTKSDFYDGGSFAAEAHSIVSVRDPEEHARMRRYLRDAFSDRSLREQEHLIAELINGFVNKIGDLGDKPSGIDIVMWFNLLTFDIIGSLAFGQSFGGIASGKPALHQQYDSFSNIESTGIENAWVSIVVKSLRMGAMADCFRRFPLIGNITKLIFPRLLKQVVHDARTHEKNTMNLVQRRINRPTDRKDFLTKILQHRHTDNLSDVQIAAHSSDFVIAGSETTATALSCVTYYLQKNPESLVRLRGEIRGYFKSFDDIDDASTTRLPFLNAVILEGMRMYPPLPFPLPRVVPCGGDTIDGYFVPGGTVVSTNPFASSMSPSNFHDPWIFNPQRWMDLTNNDVLSSSQPFSLGPRSCLGKSLGWLEMRTILAKIHYRYDLELVDPKLDWHAGSEMHTLWQKPQMNVIVRSRLDFDTERD